MAGKGIMAVSKKTTSVISKAAGLTALVVTMLAVSLCTVSVALAAEAPQWSAGFPRLIEKNALLQWDPVKGAKEYKVYRTETPGKGLKLLATVKPNRLIDKDIPSGKTYFYYVTAVVDGKEGPRSAASTITTPKEKVFVPLKKPEIAGAHVKLEQGKPVIGLRWEGGAGSDLVGYNVYRSAKKGGGYTLIGSTAMDLYTDDDVKPGVTYYYVVTSVDANFTETKYSNEVSAEIPKPKEDTVKEKKEVPPTKVRAVKLLFTIPAADMSDEEKKKQPLLRNVQDVVVDEAIGHIYATGYGYGGALVYDMNGKFQFGITKDGINGQELMNAPENLALGHNGNLYITDYTSPDLYIFDYQGRPQGSINVDISHTPGSSERTKATLYGVAVAPDGNVFVGDPRSNRIYGYDPATKKRIAEITRNDKDKSFNGISFMVFDKSGDLAFIDVNHSRIMVVGQDGKFKRTIGKKGMGAGLLYYPCGLANGNNGELFVASGMSPNIQAFSTDGEFLYLLANEAMDGPPPVADIRGIFVDSQDRIYVADGRLNRVVVLQMLDKYKEVNPEE